MTVSEQSSRKVIVGAGWVNPLTHAYVIEQAAHAHVFADDVELVQGVDYTVTDVLNPAGYAITIAVPGSWAPTNWVLDARPPIDQGKDLTVGGTFGAKYEDGLDKLTRRVERVYDLAKRAIKVPIATAVNIEYVLPAVLAGAVLGWNATGTALENKTLIELGAAVVIDDATLTGASHVNVPTQYAVKTYVDNGLSGKQPLDADLTSWAAVTRAVGFDTFAATPSSANLSAMLTDGTGTGAAVFANTPTLVTPVIGNATGQSVTLQKTGTGSSAVSRYSFNRMTVSADDVDMGLVAKKVDALEVNHLFGGSAARGGRHGLEVFCTLTAATASDNPDRNYVGAAMTGWAIASDGGTLGSEKGAIYGMNPQGVLAAGATNFSNVSGGEVNVAIVAGASAKFKSVLSLTSRGDDAVKGYTYDTVLAISSQIGCVKFDYGILFGNMNSAHPVDTTGTIIGTIGSSTVANGIDFSTYTISGSFLKGPSNTFNVSGDGTQLGLRGDNAGVELGSQGAGTNSPFIDFHSSGNIIDYDVRLVATGGSASIGQGLLTLMAGGFAVTGGYAAAAQIIPTGSVAPANGFYLPAANTLGWSTNSVGRIQLSSGGFSPQINDSVSLGQSTSGWSDLFLASGGVISFANGDATLTHVTGKQVALAGSLSRGQPSTKTADFTVADTENWVQNNKAGSPCVLTLPAAASYVGRELHILNYNAAQTVVSASANVVPLAGGAAGTAILAAGAGKWVTLVSNGSNWLTLQGN